MADLPPLKYGRVTARLVSGIGDGTDEGFAPDVEPLVGTVTFNLSARAIRVATAQPVPTTVYPQPIIATLDADGYLTWRGNRFVPLLATDDAAMSPTDLQWTVAFDLRTLDGYAVPTEPFRFALPAGATVDLTAVAPLATPALNTIITKGDKGEPGPNTIPAAEFIGSELLRVGSPARLAMWTQDRAPGVDVSRYLEGSETLEATGAANMTPLFQRAMTSLRNNPARPPLWLPDGTFRMDTEIVLQPSQTTRTPGLVGQGSGRTTLVLGVDTFAALSGYGDKAAKTAFRNLLLRGFTIDARAQTGSPYKSMKGVNIGHLFDLLVDDVFIDGAHASAFGLDFMVRAVIRNSGGRNAGRGVNKNSLLGFGSTGGFGTGAYVDESLHLIDFTSEAAGRMAVNAEWLHDAGEFHTSRILIENLISRGDAVGVGDLGNGGIHLMSGLIDGAKAAAFVIGPGGQAPLGGRDGIIGRAVTIQNGAPGSDSTPDQDIYGGHGVYLLGEGGGGYDIAALIRDNAGAAVYAEPGYRKDGGTLRVRPRAIRNAKGGVLWRAGGSMARSVRFDGGYYEDNGVALDLRTSLLAPSVVDNEFVSTNGRQAIAVRFDPTMKIEQPLIDGNVDYDTGTFIDGSAAMSSPVMGVNRHIVSPATDPGLIFFSDLKSFPAVEELGAGSMRCTAGVFTQTHVWERGRYGAEPKDGGTGNSGASGRYWDAGTAAIKVSAIIDPPLIDIGRRGIIVSYDPATGNCMVFENFSSYYQLVRYNGLTRTVIRTFGDKPYTTRLQVGLWPVPGGNTWNVYIEGDLVHTFSTSTIAKTSFFGVFGLAQLDGWITALEVRAAAA